MRKKVKNLEYYKKKFIDKANNRHNYKFDYSKINYINSIEKVEVICKEHGSFFVRPDAHIRKVGCPNCNGGVKYTKNLFIEKANIIHNNKFDYSKVNYINSNIKVDIICNQHGLFKMAPSNHLNGQSCPSCSGVKKKTTNEFKREASRIHKNKYDYSLVKYINSKSIVKIKCDKHGIFEQIAKYHLAGHGCKLCLSSKGESLVSEILNILGFNFEREYRFLDCKSNNGVALPFDFYIPEYKILIEYDGRQHYESVDIFGGDKVLEQQKINDNIRNKYCLDNNLSLIRIKYNSVEFDLKFLFDLLESKINKIDSINNKYLQPSKFNLMQFYKSYIEFIDFFNMIYNEEILFNTNKCDVFIPKLKIGFKLLGLFKNSEINNSSQLNELNILSKNEIRLIQIFEDQWVNKKEIVKSRILNLLGVNKITIYARKCQIKKLDDNKICKCFLNENHIQGFIGAKVKLGLYYNDELVSIMTFGNLRKNLGQINKENHWELLRFCNKLNTIVIGGASRLFKYFINNYNPKYIISYCDRLWSNSDNIYSKLNMSMKNTSKPSYYYIVGDTRKGRFNYRKDKLISNGCDNNLSEHKICKTHNIFRIYDAGTIKYELIN